MSVQFEPEDEPLLTVDDVCAWLKVTRHWVYDEVESRRIPHVRLGRRSLRFRRSDLRRHLASRTDDGETPRVAGEWDPIVGADEALEPLD